MQNCHIWTDTIKGTITTKNKHEIKRISKKKAGVIQKSKDIYWNGPQKLNYLFNTTLRVALISSHECDDPTLSLLPSKWRG